MLSSVHRHVRGPFVVALIAVFLVAAFEPAGVAAHPKAPPRSWSGEQMFRGILLADGPVAQILPEIRDQIRPSLLKGDPRLRRAVAVFQDQLVEALAQRDPVFFDEFAAAMRSRDRLRIQRALVDAGHRSVAALRESPAVQQVGRDLRDNPDRRREMLDVLRAAPGLETLSEADLLQALNTVVALSSDAPNADTSPDPDTSVVVVLVTVAAVAAAITIVLATSYGAVMNVAAAVNFYVSVVAMTWHYVTAAPKQAPESDSLLQEQLVDSIAVNLGA